MLEDTPAHTATPLFEREGDVFVPAREARSPWGTDSLHGGPPGALLARAVEHHDETSALRIVRMTFDLVRPVPVAPLRVSVDTVRPGRRVSVVRGEISGEGQTCVRMTALLLRETEIPLPATAVAPAEPALPAGPDDCDATPVDWPFDAFHNVGCDVRFARGAWNTPGPAFAWIRLLHPLVQGEEPSPVQRAVAAADFGNGVSAALPMGRWLFVNPDLTVQVQRPPVGEWVGLESATYLGDQGTGSVQSTLYDVHGRVGLAVQNLLIEPPG